MRDALDRHPNTARSPDLPSAPRSCLPNHYPSTPAQGEIARLLGRLLDELWERKQLRPAFPSRGARRRPLETVAPFPAVPFGAAAPCHPRTAT